MGLVRSLRRSAKRTAANRRNAKQSTGPRTPAGKQRASQNARQYGAYSASPWTPEVMEIVGVDPGPWQEMYKQLLREWKPAGPAEAMLIEDLANLYWSKEGLRRAQVAEALNDAQSHKFRKERAELEAEWKPPRTRDSIVGLTGLRGVPDCPEKVGPALELIEQITELAVGGGAPDEFDAMFERLYGIHPTRMGLDFRDLFRRLAAAGEDASSPAADPMRAKLRSLMAEERDLLLEEQKLDERVQAAEPVVAKCVAFVPISEGWDQVEETDAALDHRIERKIRVLLALQRHRRARDKQASAAGEVEAEPEIESGNKVGDGAEGS